MILELLRELKYVEILDAVSETFILLTWVVAIILTACDARMSETTTVFVDNAAKAVV